MNIKRIVIYSKDIEKIKGRSGRYARKVMTSLHKKMGKEKHQFVSLEEFCNYTGIPEREVVKHLSI